MANGNQQRCCILGVCCPPGSGSQAQAMADLLRKLGYIGTDQAALAAAERLLHALGLDIDPPAWADVEALRAAAAREGGTP